MVVGGGFGDGVGVVVVVGDGVDVVVGDGAGVVVVVGDGEDVDGRASVRFDVVGGEEGVV